MQKYIVVVLGMHRSGTSAITRALQVLGVELGDRLMPPIEGNNDKGFWEDLDVNALNMDLLSSLGHDWHTLTPVLPEEAARLAEGEFKLRAVEILRGKLPQTGAFGLKDPRIPRLLPFWQSVFAHMQLHVSYVIACRNPMSVARSMRKRDGYDLEKGYYLWLEHTIASLVHTQGASRLVVEYDLMLEDPALQLSRMSDVLKLPFDRHSAAYSEYKEQFLATSLRHMKYEVDDLALDASVPADVAALYALLVKLAADELRLDDVQVAEEIARQNDRLHANRPALAYMRINEERVVERERQIAERDGQLASLNQAVAERDGQIASLNQAVAELRESTSWKLTVPVRLVGRQILRMKVIFRALPYAKTMCGGYLGIIKRVWSTYNTEGIAGIKRRIAFSASPGTPPLSIDHVEIGHNDYTEWVRRYDTLTDAGRKKIKVCISQMTNTPLISVVMPVYNPPLDMLKEAIQSVQNQLYPNWELCIADDASTDEAAHDLLRNFTVEDSRIKVLFREKNGHISAASNSALELANGEYIALLDNDDLLPAHALFCVAQAIANHPDADLIYSDEDKIDQSGRRYDPYFKSDWNPDLFLSHNMISHLGVYRTDLVRKLGGFREGYEGSQDYDLALRCTEQLASRQIVHIPRVLYHWRSHPGSTALAGSEKNYALLAGQRSLNDHFARIDVSAKVDLLDFGMYRVRYAILSPAPMVSLIIPTRNGLSLVKQCIESILAKTTYKNYEILIVDNNSDDPDALAYFASIAEDDRIRVLRDERPFNYSALNNAAVKQARGEYLGLVNNDIEVISPEWLEEMMGLAIQPGVGAVGARLWYPNDTLQHGGCITGILGVAGHAHKYLPRGHLGYFGRAQLIQTMSVVTAACLIVNKSIWQEVGGLDESNLMVAFNDVDFCLRVREAGYRNVWTPYAELYHHESATRGNDDTPEKQARFRDEVLYMKKRWGEQLTNDPAYSPNLTLDHEDFSYAWPPRVNPI